MANLVRDPKHILPYTDLATYASIADDPKVGKNGLLPKEWYAVGILEEDSKIGFEREIETTKVKGIGFGVVAVSTKAGDFTGEVTVLGSNPIIDYIEFPETYEEDGVQLLAHSARVAKLHFCHMMERQDGSMEILVTRQKATARLADTGRGIEIEGKKIEIDYVGDSDKIVFERYIVYPDGSVKEVEVKQIRFVDLAKSDEYSSGVDEKSDTLAKRLESGKNTTPGGGAVTPNPADPQPVPAGGLRKKVTLPAGVTGGTWTLTLAGKDPITGLNYNVTPVTLKSKIEALDGITDVTVTGSATDGFVIRATGAEDITADGAGLTGGADTTIAIVNP